MKTLSNVQPKADPYPMRIVTLKKNGMKELTAPAKTRGLLFFAIPGQY